MTIKEFEIQLALGSLSIDDKMKLADNKRTSKKILTILSTDKYWTIRSRVADNKRTSKKILTILSKDEHWAVRYGVANNHNTPIEVLKILSTDKDSEVRYWALELIGERIK